MVHHLARRALSKRNGLSNSQMPEGEWLERLKDKVPWRAIWNSLSKRRMSKEKWLERLKDIVAWCAILRASSAMVCPRRRCPGNAPADFIFLLLPQQIFKPVVSSILRPAVACFAQEFFQVPGSVASSSVDSRYILLLALNRLSSLS